MKRIETFVVYNAKNLYKDWMTGGPDGAAFNTSEKWLNGICGLPGLVETNFLEA